MIQKDDWLRIWGFVPGTSDAEAAWALKLNPPRIAAPFVLKDTIEPTRGADGRMHDSLSSYRRSLEPGGNPRGERFIELGNEDMKPVTYDFDRGERREHIKQAIEDVKYGRVKPPVVLED